MPAKIWAILLLVLTLSPFTAPFPACDLARLFAAVPGAVPATGNPRSLTMSPAATLVSSVRPLARSIGRIKLVTLSGPNAVHAVRTVATATILLAVEAAPATPLLGLFALRI
jgi:hypothetical protein